MAYYDSDKCTKPLISQFKQHIMRGAIYLLVELMVWLFG